MFNPQDMQDDEEGGMDKELALIQELKEYARQGQAKELARSMGKQLPKDAPQGMSADGGAGPSGDDSIPGVEPESDEAGMGDDSGSGEIDPETLKAILAKLGG